ncbi:FAD-binding oxidoreductase [Amylibacter sp. SFDW26]|uniref:NAD(P)/FAD-dependent oxidoreductase n=1 Tax=Amylibacter sp. SFDW26 TaxID=2652722 RepID=UPI001261F73E|nr:FAD-binding oxidoreductase [Amylibacter sp. SFDW26]KAB7615469.1 FAD-binding oxidoreductase [Amylibacter sp. SFDW26]
MDLLHSNDSLGTYPNSWYAATANTLVPFPTLKGAVKADVCIIGGGYTGLSAALHLAQAGFKVAVLEAHRVGWGASGRNGGQLGSGHNQEQDYLEKLLGIGPAKKLWNIALEATDTARGLIKTHNIECDLRDGIAHANWHASDVGHDHAYVEKLNRDYGYDKITALDFDQTRALIGSEAYHGGTLDMGGAHLHPLNYALGLAKAAASAGVQIYETSEVTKVQRNSTHQICTKQGHVTATNLIYACNGYLGKLEGKTAAKVMPINNFIAATEPLEQDMAESLIAQDVAVADSKFVVNYFRRSADNRMLFGGGETYGYRFPKDIASLVRKPMLEVYPQLKNAKIEYAWGGTLGITLNRMPNFQRLSSTCYSLSGYSGHGVGMATMAGKIVSRAIQGNAEQFDAMAHIPTHNFPGGAHLRWPGLVLAMTWYALRDRLGL